MAAVNLVGPGGLIRPVSDLASLRAYAINGSWKPETGTYADAYLTVTGQSPPSPGAGATAPGIDDQVAELISDATSDTAAQLKAAFDAWLAESGGGGGGLTAEAAQDLVAAMMVAGTNVTSWVYNDAAGTLTLNVAGGGGATDPEVVRDTMATALVAGTGISVTVNDAGDTITIAATGGGGGSGRPVPAATTVAYAATVTPNVGTTDVLTIGALTGNITVANPTGSPADGQTMRLRMAQDATGGRTVTWGTAYAFGSDLTAAQVPTTPGTAWEILFAWYAAASAWRAIGLVRF